MQHGPPHDTLCHAFAQLFKQFTGVSSQVYGSGQKQCGASLDSEICPGRARKTLSIGLDQSDALMGPTSPPM